MSMQTADPSALGFDADRLARIDRHFARYVDDGRLPGWQVLVNRGGETVHAATYGRRDVEADIAWSDDTVVRMYSMTKPITSVAAMMLYEEGAFELKDPVSKFIPSFAESRVYRGGSHIKPVTEGLTEDMKIWHLLTHTSGLTYGFHHQHVTDAIYRARGFEWGAPQDLDLAATCDRWADMPLAFQPGAEWNYGVSTDVLGRVVEVASGMALDEFFEQRIFQPLKMTETGFAPTDEQRERFARLYSPNPADGRAVISPLEAMTGGLTTFLSGGGGLVGTAADYLRFTRFLLNKGELDGVRLLGTRTVDYMTRNHLPGGADLEAYGRPLFSETQFDGVGFGLGFSVQLDPVANKVLGSPGEYAWGGAASTAFWCDPVEDISVVFLTQLLPSSTHPIRTQLKQLVYQALVD
ncbi:MAG: beta-lactamase family protein [Ilumatobacter sp.]|nr:beta-lactamase family protein [Ilumatobacter sp.]